MRFDMRCMGSLFNLRFLSIPIFPIAYFSPFNAIPGIAIPPPVLSVGRLLFSADLSFSNKTEQSPSATYNFGSLSLSEGLIIQNYFEHCFV